MISPGNRWGIGARLVLQAGGRRQVREIRSSASYVSAEPPRAYFGLGKASSGRLSVRFPSGRVVELDVPEVDRRIVVAEPLAAPAR